MYTYLSVVIPLLNEEKNLPILISRLIQTIKKDVKRSYEIIFIDDGSIDKTWALIGKFHKKNKNIKGISFFRNFGHQYALTAGINLAKGKLIYMLDGDLQHPPELLKKFIAKYKEGYEIIAGVRKQRDDPAALLKKTSSRFYCWIFNKLSKTGIVSGTSDFRLISRRVADLLIDLPEQDKFYRALLPWSGFKTFYFPYNSQPRVKGKSRFGFIKRFYLGIEGVISFSTKPLALSIYLGFFAAFLAFIYGLYALYEKLILGVTQSGFTSLVAIILFVGGVQLITLGIIGIYIGRITRQIKGRPEYLIRTTIGL
ncbi:hypothetical protein A2160_02690 [Candidatus Beckwithbacteria bacterium RBG_13_42_9]|uniref:Glycosyltransferase 2-like domain-containing protein n=1 Tax=Candidatus Beckwithbacteria bacterium RBG_13_42_9 TaxID=1797457 RepID=A0A1F5E7I7_9BACT|nr:MAG: hypothetical protein A2160_02690 [Candidatus Beckwithbacteria bacterium RBG_13_42_9]